MIYFELSFPVTGKLLPCDHGYSMFMGISRLVPEARNGGWLAVEALRGAVCDQGAMHLNEQSRLKMRLPQHRLPLMIKLAGKRLDLCGHTLRLGTPQVSLLHPSSSLQARCVAIKNCAKTDSFLNAVAHNLDEAGVKGEPELGLRRVFRIGKRRVVGYGLKVHDLSEDGSIALQEQGLGNYRHIGCGFFVPL
jgi:CRISPR-associated protein Cas6